MKKQLGKHVLITAGLEDFSKKSKNLRKNQIPEKKQVRANRKSITFCGGIKNIIFIAIYAISIKITKKNM